MILFVSDVKGKGLRPGPQGKEGSVRAWTCFRIHAFTQGPFDGNLACGRATPLSPPPAVLHHIKPEADDGRLEMNLPSRPPSHAKLPDPIVEALSTASPSMLSRALSSMKDPVKRLPRPTGAAVPAKTQHLAQESVPNVGEELPAPSSPEIVSSFAVVPSHSARPLLPANYDRLHANQSIVSRSLQPHKVAQQR